MTEAYAYDNQLFADGVYSVLRVDWTLRCETPLAIRNGAVLTYEDKAKKKGRGRKLALSWETSDTDKPEHQVTALHYNYAVKNGILRSYHQVPAAGIRGALRNWTIRHFVQTRYMDNLAPPPHSAASKLDDARVDALSAGDSQTVSARDAYVANMRAALSNRGSGYQLIASLFGLATETRSELAEYTSAGRLYLETVPFQGSKFRPIDVDGMTMSSATGPDNVRRQMTVRSPLDRMIQASKYRGLHHFLEVAAKTEFDLTLRIANLKLSDLALIGLWRREINAGLLRIGALASIGRGRLSVQDESYTLWQRPDRSVSTTLTPALLTEIVPDAASDDPLVQFWKCYEVSPGSLSRFVDELNPFVGDSQS